MVQASIWEAAGSHSEVWDELDTVFGPKTKAVSGFFFFFLSKRPIECELGLNIVLSKVGCRSPGWGGAGASNQVLQVLGFKSTQSENWVRSRKYHAVNVLPGNRRCGSVSQRWSSCPTGAFWPLFVSFGWSGFCKLTITSASSTRRHLIGSQRIGTLNPKDSIQRSSK